MYGSSAFTLLTAGLHRLQGQQKHRGTTTTSASKPLVENNAPKHWLVFLVNSPVHAQIFIYSFLRSQPGFSVVD